MMFYRSTVFFYLQISQLIIFEVEGHSSGIIIKLIQINNLAIAAVSHSEEYAATVRLPDSPCVTKIICPMFGRHQQITLRRTSLLSLHIRRSRCQFFGPSIHSHQVEIAQPIQCTATEHPMVLIHFAGFTLQMIRDLSLEYFARTIILWRMTSQIQWIWNRQCLATFGRWCGRCLLYFRH